MLAGNARRHDARKDNGCWNQIGSSSRIRAQGGKSAGVAPGGKKRDTKEMGISRFRFNPYPKG